MKDKFKVRQEMKCRQSGWRKREYREGEGKKRRHLQKENRR